MEAIVATSIVLIGLVPILTLLTTSLKQAAFVQDQLIAANLAQEGVEIVQAVRLENWINARTFNFGIASGLWCAEYKTASLFSCDQTLKIEPTTGFYYHIGTGNPTKFKRRIEITNNPGGRPNEILAQSVVEWTTRGIPFSTVVEDHLFNWLP